MFGEDEEEDDDLVHLETVSNLIYILRKLTSICTGLFFAAGRFRPGGGERRNRKLMTLAWIPRCTKKLLSCVNGVYCTVPSG